MTFHPGDRVIATKCGWAYVQPGDTGRVLYTFDQGGQVAVEWDRYVYGHTGNRGGLGGKLGYCTYEGAGILDLLSEDHEAAISFGPELEELL